jgi:hypothetical protein
MDYGTKFLFVRSVRHLTEQHRLHGQHGHDDNSERNEFSSDKTSADAELGHISIAKSYGLVAHT